MIQNDLYPSTAALVFIVAMALSVALTLFARWFSPKVGLIDIPRGRHKHSRPVSKLGALPLWGAFTLTVILAQGTSLASSSNAANPYELIRTVGLLLGGTVIFVAGLLDDRFDLPAWVQWIGQTAAAAVGVLFLIFIETFNNPLTNETIPALPYALTIVITVFWYMLMMNTVNFLDGSDGLAGGVVFIAAALLFIHALRVEPQQMSVSLLPLALMGTLLGFLFFNWHPASIFMGSGAVYLGFVIGALAIIGGAKMATILLVMGLPLLDLAWQAARRLSEGRHPFSGDRGHLHFRLIDRGFSPKLLAILYYAFCATFGALALLTTSRMFKFIALIVMVLIVAAAFVLVARLPTKKNGDKPQDKPHDSAEIPADAL
jgi:UDP-GlcNAc:undecaprenyl-phosphate/decaprenyl-phosphate GlcNAc-1-phosphate transferase